MKTNIKIAALAVAGFSLIQGANAETKPLKALLITGGCCHDYKAQKDILKKGIEARANIIVDQIHSDKSDTKPDIAIYGIPEYAKGYDIVIHDECAAGISDIKTIEGVLAPHKAGTPGVNLHCAMHSYRSGNFQKPVETGVASSKWFEYLGIQSFRHGKQLPIEISFTDKTHPLVGGMGDWTTINEELYNNAKVFDTAHALAIGKQLGEEDSIVAWTNDYNGTRVFSTTIGHNNATVEDARYLDLVTRGVLWACGKMDDKGVIAEGYGPVAEKK
jgi:hypothetical protein